MRNQITANGVLRTIIVGAIIFIAAVISSFIYCHFSYANYIRPEIKKEIAKELYEKYKLGSDISYQSIIDRTETYYDRKFQHLLYLFGTIVALFGIGLPVIITFFQHISLKEDKESISRAHDELNKAKADIKAAKKELTELIDEERARTIEMLITLANSNKQDYAKAELLTFALEIALSLKNSSETIKGCIDGLSCIVGDYKHEIFYNKHNTNEMIKSLKKSQQKCRKQFSDYSVELGKVIENFQGFYNDHKKWSDELSRREQEAILGKTK